MLFVIAVEGGCQARRTRGYSIDVGSERNGFCSVNDCGIIVVFLTMAVDTVDGVE